MSDRPTDDRPQGTKYLPVHEKQCQNCDYPSKIPHGNESFENLYLSRQVFEIYRTEVQIYLHRVPLAD